MQLLSADVTIFFKDLKKKYAAENMIKPTLKVALNGPKFFFSIANWPKTSPNLIFCSI